ncbi:hypothetical protein AC1031_017516 [Aphanomyces cochlioides]|nr:hypothetical protein AC1031_017516 [Aphanomyces cochlioides]
MAALMTVQCTSTGTCDFHTRSSTAEDGGKKDKGYRAKIYKTPCDSGDILKSSFGTLISKLDADFDVPAQRLIMQDDPMDAGRCELEVTETELQRYRRQLQDAQNDVKEKMEFVDTLTTWLAGLFCRVLSSLTQALDLRKLNI